MRGYEVPGCQLLLRRAGFRLAVLDAGRASKTQGTASATLSRTVVHEVQPVTMDRFQQANELRLDQAGDLVKLAGRVTRVQDLGGLSFLHLQDATGVVQVVADPNRVPTTSELRVGSYVLVEGTVRPRPKGTEAPYLETGELDVVADRLEVLRSHYPNPRLPS